MTNISIITAVYNRGATITEAISSVSSQTSPAFEHLVIDGASSDGTVAAVRAAMHAHMRLISEPDGGIYDAINKGIAQAKGDVIGLLHSDDFLAHNQVLELVDDAFRQPDVNAVYGDLDYVSADDTSRVIRRWRSGSYSPDKLRHGWMPPHPTLFLRREVFERCGTYDTSYHIAADYDAILRFFSRGELRPYYIPQVLVKMRMGGESNRSIGKVVQKSVEDYRALRSNRIGGFISLALKNLRKLGQFIV